MNSIKPLHILILVLLIGAVVILFKNGVFAPTESKLLSEDKHVFLSTEVSLSYDDFLKDLEEDCPYYEPNGAQYRECLVNLLTTREQGADQYQADLIRDVQAVTDPEFQTARETFVSHLEELGQMWKPYRDQLCLTTFDSMWGGSNQGGATNTCRLYETARYSELLKKLRVEWL